MQSLVLAYSSDVTRKKRAKFEFDESNRRLHRPECSSDGSGSETDPGFYFTDVSGRHFGAFKVASGMYLFVGERVIAHPDISEIRYSRAYPERDGIGEVEVLVQMLDGEELRIAYDLDDHLRDYWTFFSGELGGFLLDIYNVPVLDPGERLKGLWHGIGGFRELL